MNIYVSIAIFFLLNLINVVLGTMRSILTVKSTPTVAMIINTVSYTFYSGIVKMISGQPLWIVLATTALTNIIGVYLATFILNRFKKDQLWRITATISNKIDTSAITDLLKTRGIKNVVYLGDGAKIIDIYSKSQGESLIIKEILENVQKEWNAKIKWSVVEINKKL